AKQAEAIGVHPLRTTVDTLIAHPRRIAGDDIEAAARHHRGEMDVVREEVELAFLGARQKTPRLDDAGVQLAAPRDVERPHASEKVLLRRGELLQLAVIDLDWLAEKLGRELLIVPADQTRQRGPLALRRTAISGDQVGLRVNGGQPLSIDL